jgi:hypothetical protein
MVIVERPDFILATEGWERNTCRKYVRLLHDEISKTGAKTVLSMSWGFAGTFEQYAKAYLELGNELGVYVVPVAIAWERSLELNPELPLDNGDQFLHANNHGNYLTACVFFAALTGMSPGGLPYTADLDDEKAEFLQQVAWDTVMDFYRW